MDINTIIHTYQVVICIAMGVFALAIIIAALNEIFNG